MIAANTPVAEVPEIAALCSSLRSHSTIVAATETANEDQTDVNDEFTTIMGWDRQMMNVKNIENEFHSNGESFRYHQLRHLRGWLRNLFSTYPKHRQVIHTCGCEAFNLHLLQKILGSICTKLNIRYPTDAASWPLETGSNPAFILGVCNSLIYF